MFFVCLGLSLCCCETDCVNIISGVVVALDFSVTVRWDMYRYFCYFLVGCMLRLVSYRFVINTSVVDCQVSKMTLLSVQWNVKAY